MGDAGSISWVPDTIEIKLASVSAKRFTAARLEKRISIETN